MKHYFHFLFTAALLLGSLILYTNQKSECPDQPEDKLRIEHMALQAEVPSREASESLVQSSRHHPGIVSSFTICRFRQSEFLNLTDHQVCMKRQVQIHLELKPLIADLSGTYLLHRSGYDDPPLS